MGRGAASFHLSYLLNEAPLPKGKKLASCKGHKLDGGVACSFLIYYSPTEAFAEIPETLPERAVAGPGEGRPLPVHVSGFGPVVFGVEKVRESVVAVPLAGGLYDVSTTREKLLDSEQMWCGSRRVISLQLRRKPTT